MDAHDLGYTTGAEWRTGTELINQLAITGTSYLRISMLGQLNIDCGYVLANAMRLTNSDYGFWRPSAGRTWAEVMPLLQSHLAAKILEKM